MQRTHRRRSTALFLALGLTIAFASLGVGYAAWMDQITVTGSVYTADMNIRWLTNADAPGSINCFDSDGSGGLGSVSAVRDPQTPTDNLIFTITNGYPGYWAKCFLMWVNDGQVPVKSTGITINGLNAAAFPGGRLYDLDGGGDDLRIRYSNGGFLGQTAVGYPGTEELYVEVLPTSNPNAQLTFTGEHTFQLGAP